MERASRPSRLGWALDFASDWALLAYAVWTLIAYGGMVTHAKVSLLVFVWVATIPFLGVLLVILSRRSTDSPSPNIPATAPGWEWRRSSNLLVLGLAAAALFALLAPLRVGIPWVVVWGSALVAVALALYAGGLRLGRSGEWGAIASWPAHALAAGVALAFAGMSLFINRPNLDDAFYVNRATATAQLNRIPVRDVLFTHEQVAPTLAAGLPVDTFSALEGALGRLLGIQAPSVAYYLIPPLMTFFATWALWRLLRSWAPRAALLCFALGSVYWLFSAQLPLTPGSYFLARMWQGKVIFAAWLVPTAYIYLTRWLGRREALTGVLLVAAGVCSIGMTASATFVAPLLFATAAVPLLAARAWRGLPVVVLAAVFPFLVGVVATAKYPVGDVFGGPRHVAAWYFGNVFGYGVLAGVAALGLCAAPWLARAGPARALAAGIAVVALVLLAPRVLTTLRDVTHVSNALRRTLWIVPLPAMVGLLASVPVAQLLRLIDRALLARFAPVRLGRLVALVPALLVAGAVIVFGQPLWSRSGHSAWVERPTWKLPRGPLASARSILARYHGDGPILANEPIMNAIALITVEPKAVDARRWYATLTPEPAERTRARLALTDFVSGRSSPPPAEVRRALSGLRVGLVCVSRLRPRLATQVKILGPYQEVFRLRALVCLRRE